MSNTWKLVIAILIPLAVGLISGLFTANNVTGWFTSIVKPSWNPPNWIFGPVWTTLYILMGIAFFLVWKSEPDDPIKKTATALFAIQLFFNFCWSLLFFQMHQPGWAFAELVVLWLLILATIFVFAKVNNTAAWLLVPYISWVTFAGILNYTIWRLN